MKRFKRSQNTEHDVPSYITDEQDKELLEEELSDKEHEALSYNTDEQDKELLEEELPDKELKEDPWITAHRKNHVESRLCRLPGELIKEIMTHLTPSAMYHFRQSSRIFMSLSGERRFTKIMDRLFSQRWEQNPLKRTCSSDSIKPILQNDLLCKPCREFRKCGDRDLVLSAFQEQMYCSGCCSHHPRIFFSEAQRAVGKHERVCIGREGHIRLCQHQVLTWSDIEEARQRNTSLLRCTDRSHNLTNQQREQMGTSSGSLNWVEDKVFPKVILYCQWSGPRITEVDIQLVWQFLPFTLSPTPKKPLTMMSLHDKLKAAAVDSTLSLCPHESFKNISIMRAFDPNHCACLSYAFKGSDFTYHRVSPRSQCDRYNCCAFRACAHLSYYKKKIFLPTVSPCTQQGQGYTTKCPYCNGRDLVQHRSVCADCETQYAWYREGEQIKLQRVSKTTVKTPLDAEWLRLLDSNSFDFKDDSTRHLLWCSNPSCAISRRGNSWIAVMLSTLGVDYKPQQNWSVYMSPVM